jgi:hypothetical protein
MPPPRAPHGDHFALHLLDRNDPYASRPKDSQIQGERRDDQRENRQEDRKKIIAELLDG